MLLIVVGLIFVALLFDYINGFHDAANSIATVVSTRVLSPGQAVAWAAFFNFVAAFGFGTAGGQTVGVGVGGVLQLRRRLRLRHCGGQNDGEGDDRHLRRHVWRDPRRPGWRDRLGPDHPVLRSADELLARVDRRPRRGGGLP